MRAPAFLLACLLLPLAGCLDGATASGKDLLPTAHAKGSAWHEDAVLQSVASLEIGELPPGVQAALAQRSSSDPKTMQDPEMALLQYRDSHVGDGRAGGWAFMFTASEGSLLLVLDSSGKELLRHEDAHAAGRDRDEPALADPKIDSDEASDLAAQANSTFAQLRGHAVLGTVALGQGPHGPLWAFMLLESYGLDGQAPRTAVAAVDATNGTVVTDLDGMDGSSPFGGQSHSEQAPVNPYFRPAGNRTHLAAESDQSTGSLDAARADQDTSFDLQSAGHQELRLQLDLPNALVGTRATATVTAPDGSTTHITYQAAALQNSPVRTTVQMPEAGHYKVDVHLDTGVMQQFSFAWCAPGSPDAAKDSGPACSDQ